MDGLQCCASEPKCSFGQECCVDPNNPGKNQCADKCDYGKQDEFCRINNECDAGFACVDAKCTACGGEGQPCCGKTCSGNDKQGNALACAGEKCVGCGLIGNPCCADQGCSDETAGEPSLAQCLGGLCAACGGNQQPACLGDRKCLVDYLLNNNNCFKCGEVNEPCCEGMKCNSKLKLECRSGFCQ